MSALMDQALACDAISAARPPQPHGKASKNESTNSENESNDSNHNNKVEQQTGAPCSGAPWEGRLSTLDWSPVATTPSPTLPSPL